MMQLRSGAATGPGRVRQVNQDRYLVFDNRLFVVADGMGGHRGGEVAAQLTVDTLNTSNDVHSSDDLQAAILEANRTIFQHAADDPELSGMGTTVTAIALLSNGETDDPLLSIANVGDSRTYRLTPAGFEQLTEDHSVIGELMRDGRITAEEALQHRHRSVITRALGVEPSVEVDIIEVIPTPGDRYLLCSDGLYGEVADPAIASILRRFADPNEACEELMAAAITRGGRDNITAVIVDVIDDSDPAYLASQALGAAPYRGSAALSDNPAGEPTPAQRAAATNENASTPKAQATKSPKVKHARKPSPINLRVLLFIAVLAGLGAIVAWVWKNAPESDILPTTTVATTESSIPAGPVVPVLPSTSPGSETPTTPGTTIANPTVVPVPAAGTAVSTVTSAAATDSGATNASGAPTTLAPTTTDPFGEPATTKTVTTRTKKK